MSLRVRLPLSLAALAWPAAAWANPGPDLDAVLGFLALTAIQFVAALVVLAATPERTATPWLALGLALLGFGAIGWWPATIAFQAPAALLLLVAAFSTKRTVARSAGLLAALLTLLILPWASYRAAHPRGLFALSAEALGGPSQALGAEPSRPDAGRPDAN